MHPIRLISALLLLGLAACGSMQGSQSDATASLPLTIDQPTAPFPYNSRICP